MDDHLHRSPPPLPLFHPNAGGAQPSKLCARGHWRPAEDDKLKELVSAYGPQNWNLIADNLKGRSGKSCRLRWFNQLDPRINRKAFSEEEEERLLAAHTAYGNKWALIARIFPGRTDNAVKNHWHVVMARRSREQSGAYRRRKLSSAFTAARLRANNACSGESTVTTTYRDESLSASPDLSLIVGCKKEMVAAARNGDHQQNACSESNSEASAAESAANQRMNEFVPVFFDFLGVGDT